MDFSPYRKKGTSFSSNEYRKYYPLGIAIGVILLGFLLYTTVRSTFFSEEGIAITSTFQKTEGSVAESQVSGIEIWSLLSDGEMVTEGDKIRVLSGTPSSIELRNGSKITLGSGSEILIKTMKETEDALLYGEIVMTSGPLSVQAKGTVDPENSLKLWIDEQHYIKANTGSFVIQDGLIHVVQGEGIEVIEQNAKGKISNQKTIGVGQSMHISSFSVNATEDEAKFLPLYTLLTGNTDTTPSNAPAKDLSAPKITNFTFTGSAIEVSEAIQRIEGTADAGATKIIVSFSNGSSSNEQEISLESITTTPLPSSLSKDENNTPSSSKKSWSYIASPTYETMKEGLNTYKIYAENANKERSPEALLVLQYTANGENVFDATGGDLMITSPNQGKSGSIEGNIITITGTAPKDAAKIIVTNKKLQNPYTLQKFQPGDTSWKYYTAEMEPGVYAYSIEAVSATGKVISTKNITITVGGTTPTSSANPSPKTSSTPTPTVQTSIPTPKPSPTVNSSTMEAGR